MIRLEYLAPPPELKPFISTYYLFDTDEPQFSDVERADVAQLRFFISGEGELSFPDGSHFKSHRLSLFGPRMTASPVALKGPTRLFGLGLLPAGWTVLIGRPAVDYVNTLVDASELLEFDTDALLDSLGRMQTLKEMAAQIGTIANSLGERAAEAPHWFIRAVDEWLEQRLSPDIADLERRTGLSRRQIEKMTKQVYGASPKLLQRKYRALRTANAIANGNGDWQDFIDDAYYDQSHCIREIKEFVGITPGAVKEHASRLAKLTFGRSQLAGMVSPLSSQT